MIGATKAIDQFDPSKPEALCTFAEHKIRGSILDQLRSLDPVPRAMRQQLKKIENFIDHQQLDQTGQELTRSEVIDTLFPEFLTNRGVNEKSRLALLATVTTNTTSLSATSQTSYGEGKGLFAILPRVGATPEAISLKREAQDRLMRAVNNLPEKHRKVVLDIYALEKSQSQIGYEMGVSPARISQLKARALQKLRAELESTPSDQKESATTSLIRRSLLLGEVGNVPQWLQRMRPTNPGQASRCPQTYCLPAADDDRIA